MPTRTGKARGLARKKRKREATPESDISEREQADSCIPVAKKVKKLNMHEVNCAFIRSGKCWSFWLCKQDWQ